MMKLIFTIGAGIMYLPFHFMGVKDYFLVSIIVCIILLPLFFNILYFSNIFTFKGKIMKIISGIWFLISCHITYTIYEGYLGRYDYNIVKFKYQIFEKCFTHLKYLAGFLNVSYYTINVIIYMIIPILLIMFNYTLLKLNKYYNTPASLK